MFKELFTEAVKSGAMPEANVLMDNKNGKKFMELIYTLLKSGAKIESYALGRWGMLEIPLGGSGGINVRKLTPKGRKSKTVGVTSFASGDKVELIKIDNNNYKVQNII